jgi:YHS domain-containing protein
MRQLSVFLLVVLMMFSCQKADDSKNQMLDEAAVQKKNFAGINFDLAYDPVCKMSLSSGIADTISLNGKTYGFCRATCKFQFQCNPDGFLK